MSVPVRSRRTSVPRRCLEIRERLARFEANALGALETGEVRGHLLSCAACEQVYAEQILNTVASGTVPLLAPPPAPSLAPYVRPSPTTHPRFGIVWSTLRDALKAADQQAREWAGQRLEEIRAGLALLGDRSSVVPMRGAMRQRTVPSDVLTPAGEPSGTTIAFRVRSAPEITSDGRFTIWLETSDGAHDGRVVMCTIELPETQPVTFAGTLRGSRRGKPSEVRIDENGVPGPAREIPLEHVRLAILPVA